MKIMQIAPFGLPIREGVRYGGIERVIRDLDKEFFKRGHGSSVVATGDSKVYGTLCPTLEKSSWISEKNQKDGCKYKKDLEAHDKSFETHCSMALNYIKENKPEIIHDHLGFIRSKAFQKAKNVPPILTTLHGPLDGDNIKRFKDLEKSICGRNVRFNSISKSQREKFSEIMSVDYTILNGLEVENYPYTDHGDGFVFSLGLISPAKGPDIAIKASKKLGKKIVVAGPIHQFVPEIKDFWEREVKSEIDVIYDKEISPENVEGFVKDFMKSSSNSIYIGELNDKQKVEWFKRADAFYFPIRWQEPFGLVMIESNACGTPIIAYNGGAVPEIIEHGKNGYVVKQGDLENFLYYASKVRDLSRKACRKHIEKNFTIERQAKEYLEVYNDIINRT